MVRIDIGFSSLQYTSDDTVKVGSDSLVAILVPVSRPTTQTSLYPNYNSTLTSSCNAVDGIYDSNLLHQSCIFTDWDGTSDYPSWQVDLGAIYNIAYIRMTLREDDTQPNYVREIYIMVGNSVTADGEIINSSICYHYPGIPSNLGTPLKLYCNPPKAARYIKVQKDDIYFSWLSFCELEVFTDITNGNCPDPPQDWTCRDLDHTAIIPRTQCIDTTQETTTEVVTTTETITTTVPTTTETITTAVPTTTETITTAVPTTTETITTAVPTTSAKSVTTTETITTAVPTTIDSATTTTKLGSTSGNSISESTSSPSNSNNTCYCPCNSGGYLVLTDAELKEKIEKIISEIKIDPKATSLAKRKLISAVDSRPSAKAVGSLGIVILVVIAGFIIIMDSNVIFRSIEQLVAKGRKIKVLKKIN
ncbi:unnamed protein product [Mytilus coruscus]|uniref:Fucolectin tachylectin-4 pentraxin-1 domain-containing protein n=1 Tax=Mytilus coruscus TaxID=42192 RepID=A0A6J8AUT9_MYTCO|nr:unnamed protein product [Mytilus coruscus]